MNVISSLLCVLIALLSSYILKLYGDINDVRKSNWKEYFIYIVCTGIIFCELSLAYALFVVMNNAYTSNMLFLYIVLSIVFTIVVWIICYLKKINIIIFISMIWCILICCFMLYLFYESFISKN